MSNKSSFLFLRSLCVDNIFFPHIFDWPLILTALQYNPHTQRRMYHHNGHCQLFTCSALPHVPLVYLALF